MRKYSPKKEKIEHRCDALVGAGGYGHDAKVFYFGEFKEWWIQDSESEFSGIKFCPFCGDRLE